MSILLMKGSFAALIKHEDGGPMDYRYVGIFTFALLFLAFFTSGPEKGDPRIARIVPDVSLSTTARTINIEGTNFNKDSLVYVGDHLLRRVDVKSDSLLRARLPKDLDVGTYPVKVVSPGHRDVPASKLTIVPSETAPVLTQLNPATVKENCPQIVTIEGDNFRKGAQARCAEFSEPAGHQRVLPASGRATQEAIHGKNVQPQQGKV